MILVREHQSGYLPIQRADQSLFDDGGLKSLGESFKTMKDTKNKKEYFLDSEAVSGLF